MKNDLIPEWALDVAKSLLIATRAKDPATFSHCVRVGEGCRHLAQAAGLNEYEQKIAEYAGMLHDVGKIVVPDAILLKPGKLTDEEMEVMKLHPIISAEMVNPFMHEEFFRDMIPGILHHHERIDGKGYPNGLRGERVPLMARIILIADTFDAMTANRAYRAGLPPERAVQELLTYSGTQFDVQLVQTFLTILPGQPQTTSLPEKRAQAGAGKRAA